MKMKPTPDNPVGFFAERERKRIRPDEKIPLDLSGRERDLILQHTSPPTFRLQDQETTPLQDGADQPA